MDDKLLIAEARKHLGQFTLARPDLTAGSVSAALVTTAGNLHTGICVDVACGIGFCAEHTAVASMLKNRETVIRKIVAVGVDGVMAPCGRCRELMSQVDGRNFECEVVLADGVRTLRELLPAPWNR